MQWCEWIDYTEREDCFSAIFESSSLSAADMRTLGTILPTEQIKQIRKGDDLAVYFINNPIEGIQAILTLWVNLDMACISVDGTTIWGYFDDLSSLMLTEQFAKATEYTGNQVMGTEAYNLHGVKGIYARSYFYTLQEEWPLAKVA
jgi:hypothetical protein